MFRRMFHARYMATAGVRLFSTISPHNQQPISTIINSHTNCSKCAHYNIKNGKCHQFIDTKNNEYIEAKIARGRADLCGPNGNTFKSLEHPIYYFYGTAGELAAGALVGYGIITLIG